MDELEKHIRSIRDELDIHEPGHDLWAMIGRDLQGNEKRPENFIVSHEESNQNGQAGIKGRRMKMRSVIWRAAVVVIVAGLALATIAGMLLRSQILNDPQVAAVKETYRYYDERIKTLYEEAEPLLTANPDISTELNLGMTELDSLSAQIIHDLNDNIASSEVIEALISNYRLRIELLEDMLSLMREGGVEPDKNRGNEL